MKQNNEKSVFEDSSYRS